MLVLTGAGDVAFCAGADLKNIGSLGRREGARESGPMGISRITDIGKPAIAAIEGYCTAGGLELACWCDFRIAGASAQLGVLNRRWGVPLVDGGTQRLPRIVGLGNALYLIETGALLDAQQARAIGLVQEVVPRGHALERALHIARTMSSYPQRGDPQRSSRDARRTDDADRRRPRARSEGPQSDGQRSDRWPNGLRRFAAGERPEPLRPP